MLALPPWSSTTRWGGSEVEHVVHVVTVHDGQHLGADARDDGEAVRVLAQIVWIQHPYAPCDAHAVAFGGRVPLLQQGRGVHGGECLGGAGDVMVAVAAVRSVRVASALSLVMARTVWGICRPRVTASSRWRTARPSGLFVR
jgi:hypothetical protein